MIACDRSQLAGDRLSGSSVFGHRADVPKIAGCELSIKPQGRGRSSREKSGRKSCSSPPCRTEVHSITVGSSSLFNRAPTGEAPITVIIAGSERLHASYLLSADAGGLGLQDRRRHQAMSYGPRTGFAEMLNQETGDVRFCQVLVTRKRPGIGDLAQFLPNPYAAEWGTCAPRPDAPSIGYSSCRGKLVAQAPPRCGPVALLWYRTGGANGPALTGCRCGW